MPRRLLGSSFSFGSSNGSAEANGDQHDSRAPPSPLVPPLRKRFFLSASRPAAHTRSRSQYQLPATQPLGLERTLSQRRSEGDLLAPHIDAAARLNATERPLPSRDMGLSKQPLDLVCWTNLIRALNTAVLTASFASRRLANACAVIHQCDGRPT